MSAEGKIAAACAAGIVRAAKAKLKQPLQDDSNELECTIKNATLRILFSTDDLYINSQKYDKEKHAVASDCEVRCDAFCVDYDNCIYRATLAWIGKKPKKVPEKYGCLKDGESYRVIVEEYLSKFKAVATVINCDVPVPVLLPNTSHSNFLKYKSTQDARELYNKGDILTAKVSKCLDGMFEWLGSCVWKDVDVESKCWVLNDDPEFYHHVKKCPVRPLNTEQPATSTENLTGNILLIINPSIGIITFEYHGMEEKALFLKDAVYINSSKIKEASLLGDVLHIGDKVSFDVEVCEFGCKSYYRATVLWLGERPREQKNNMSQKNCSPSLQAGDAVRSLENAVSVLSHVPLEESASTPKSDTYTDHDDKSTLSCNQDLNLNSDDVLEDGIDFLRSHSGTMKHSTSAGGIISSIYKGKPLTVNFTSNIVYVNGKRCSVTSQKKSVTKSKQVFFDAYLIVEEGKISCYASLVWTGKKPKDRGIRTDCVDEQSLVQKIHEANITLDLGRTHDCSLEPDSPCSHSPEPGTIPEGSNQTQNTHCPSELRELQGKVVHCEPDGIGIIHSSYQGMPLVVHFSSKSFFINGKRCKKSNWKRCVQVGCEINFDAWRFQGLEDAPFYASMAWLGDRPKSPAKCSIQIDGQCTDDSSSSCGSPPMIGQILKRSDGSLQKLEQLSDKLESLHSEVISAHVPEFSFEKDNSSQLVIPPAEPVNVITKSSLEKPKYSASALNKPDDSVQCESSCLGIVENVDRTVLNRVVNDVESITIKSLDEGCSIDVESGIAQSAETGESSLNIFSDCSMYGHGSKSSSEDPVERCGSPHLVIPIDVDDVEVRSSSERECAISGSTDGNLSDGESLVIGETYEGTVTDLNPRMSFFASVTLNGKTFCVLTRVQNFSEKKRSPTLALGVNLAKFISEGDRVKLVIGVKSQGLDNNIWVASHAWKHSTPLKQEPVQDLVAEDLLVEKEHNKPPETNKSKTLASLLDSKHGEVCQILSESEGTILCDVFLNPAEVLFTKRELYVDGVGCHVQTLGYYVHKGDNVTFNAVKLNEQHPSGAEYVATMVWKGIKPWIKQFNIPTEPKQKKMEKKESDHVDTAKASPILPVMPPERKTKAAEDSGVEQCIKKGGPVEKQDAIAEEIHTNVRGKLQKILNSDEAVFTFALNKKNCKALCHRNVLYKDCQLCNTHIYLCIPNIGACISFDCKKLPEKHPSGATFQCTLAWNPKDKKPQELSSIKPVKILPSFFHNKAYRILYPGGLFEGTVSSVAKSDFVITVRVKKVEFEEVFSTIQCFSPSISQDTVSRHRNAAEFVCVGDTVQMKIRPGSKNHMFKWIALHVWKIPANEEEYYQMKEKENLKKTATDFLSDGMKGHVLSLESDRGVLKDDDGGQEITFHRNRSKIFGITLERFDLQHVFRKDQRVNYDVELASGSPCNSSPSVNVWVGDNSRGKLKQYADIYKYCSMYNIQVETTLKLVQLVAQSGDIFEDDESSSSSSNSSRPVQRRKKKKKIKQQELNSVISNSGNREDERTTLRSDTPNTTLLDSEDCELSLQCQVVDDVLCNRDISDQSSLQVPVKNDTTVDPVEISSPEPAELPEETVDVERGEVCKQDDLTCNELNAESAELNNVQEFDVEEDCIGNSLEHGVEEVKNSNDLVDVQKQTGAIPKVIPKKRVRKKKRARTVSSDIFYPQWDNNVKDGSSSLDTSMPRSPSPSPPIISDEEKKEVRLLDAYPTIVPAETESHSLPSERASDESQSSPSHKILSPAFEQLLRSSLHDVLKEHGSDNASSFVSAEIISIIEQKINVEVFNRMMKSAVKSVLALSTGNTSESALSEAAERTTNKWKSRFSDTLRTTDGIFRKDSTTDTATLKYTCPVPNLQESVLTNEGTTSDRSKACDNVEKPVLNERTAENGALYVDSRDLEHQTACKNDTVIEKTDKNTQTVSTGSVIMRNLLPEYA